jgi:signal transduction histidine kinase
MFAFEHVVAGWPMVLAMGGVLAGGGVREVRRRRALNEALHEARRPLQVLALSTPRDRSGSRRIEGSVRMVAGALERLDREINGGGAAVAVRTEVRVGPMLEAAVERWRPRAALGGRAIELRCRCGSALVAGDPTELTQALDNLVANAVEHGGARIAVVANVLHGSILIAVRDSGSGARRVERRQRRRLAERIAGTSRHGHGLRVVRRIAAAHGGSFALQVGAGATEAVLELPLAGTAAP